MNIPAALASAGPADYFAVLVSYIGNPLSMLFAIQRKPFGWWIVGVSQVLFVAFAAWSGDWRFGGQILCLGMGIYGIWMWQIRGTHKPALDSAPAPRNHVAIPNIETAAQLAYGAWAWERLRSRDPEAAQRWVVATRTVAEYLSPPKIQSEISPSVLSLSTTAHDNNSLIAKE